MSQLNIGIDFSLPVDAVCQTIAVLAKKGAGKSYLASVMAEEMLAAHQQIVAIDPTGAWYGLRSSADGTSEGFPIVVLGGDHGDVPLDEHAGETIARWLVERRFSAIIDLSLFRKGQVRRFLTPFLEALYRLNREPMHLFVDEADDIAPQKPFGDEAAMVGAMEDVVKRGRKKGIGCTLITQRPADLAKQVLTQCEMVVALRLVHPRDIKAVMEWINVHADPGQAKDMLGALPSLPTGTAFFWSPGWGNIFERVKVRARKTFDSGATPKPGQRAKAPAKLAPVDVAKLGAEIAATVEKAKENDPAALRKRIADLERELAAKPAAPAKVERVEVPVFDDEDWQRIKLAADCFESFEKTVKEGVEEVREVYKLLNGLSAKAIAMQRSNLSKPVAIIPTAIQRAAPPSVKKQASSITNPITDRLPVGEAKVLTALIQFPAGLRREQLTVLTGYKRSSRDTYIQRLREKSLVETTGGDVKATSEGRAALPNAEPLPTGKALQDYWLARLPPGERACLEVLIRAYPNAVERTAIDEATGYKRSARDTYLQRLSAKQLIVKHGGGVVAASRELF